MGPFLKQQLFIASIIYVGQMLVGYGMGWTAPIIPKLQDIDQTPLPNIITDGQASWVGSLLYVGSVTGPHVSGYLSNRIGRKPCLIIGGILVIVSFITVIITQNLAMVYAVRICNGLGTGIINVSNLVYLGEIAPTNIRGILLTCTGIFSTLGTLVIYSTGPYISYAATGYLGLAITVSYTIGLLFIPESPVFQVIIGNNEAAINTLKKLGREKDADIVTNKKSKIEVDENKSKWTEVFTVNSNRKALFITGTLGILQQLSGVVAVIFFATFIFETAGSSIRPDIATIIIGVTQVASSCITPFFVEKNGRRTLLMLSTAICSISLAVLGIYFLLNDKDHPVIDNIGWIPLVSLIVFFLSFDMGFGIIPSTLAGEMFTLNMRSTGSAVSITTAWLFGFGVSTAFGYMVSGIGGAITFWIFAASCALACVFTAVFVPETKGKSLQEIEDIFNKR